MEWPPPLLAERNETQQLLLAVVTPAVFGLIVGICLGASKGLYTVLSLVAIIGGVLAGFDHDSAREAALRGAVGGALFGTMILFGHNLSGLHAKTSLPDPPAALVLITIAGGVVLGAIGGALRARRTRRTGAALS